LEKPETAALKARSSYPPPEHEERDRGRRAERREAEPGSPAKPRRADAERDRELEPGIGQDADREGARRGGGRRLVRARVREG
jgi:hypothetical protein